jgi:hypothetical protein
MATLYRYNDAGAPAKPANANYNGAKWFMDIIKACLVTGYGSKTAAGWTIVYEDTTVNAPRLAITNGNGVIEFVTWGTTSVGIFIWDAITTPGTGRLFDTAWNTAVSTGINGWAGQNAKLPSASPTQVVGNTFSSMLVDTLNAQWSVVADSKSAWISFHYALNSPLAEPGDNTNISTIYHPKFFFGALKSLGWPASQFGNFFLMYDAQSVASSSASSGAGGNMNKIIGLRTPLNLIPATNTEFEVARFTVEGGNSLWNTKDSVRLVAPLFAVYNGADRPSPAGMPTSQSRYTFATFPGIGCFAPPGTADFWQYYSAEYATTSNLEVFNINGLSWLVLALRIAASNTAVTTQQEWWA